MQRIPEDSRPGSYDVYLNDNGERVIVLERLDLNQPIELYPLQEWLVPYVPGLSVLYWLLVLVVAVYLIGVHLVVPLTRRFLIRHE